MADEVLEHVDLGEYIASNVFSLEEFEELNGENIHGPLGILDDVLTYILRYMCYLEICEALSSTGCSEPASATRLVLGFY